MGHPKASLGTVQDDAPAVSYTHLDVYKRQVQSSLLPVGNVEAELGRYRDLASNRPKRLPDHLLVRNWPVDLSGVEKCHTTVRSLADEGHTFLLGDFIGITKIQPHAAIANG